MQIISGTTRFRIPGATAVAIGKFDGVHLGHRRLLDALLRQKEQGLSPTVFTFDPSPAVLFGKPGSPDAQELTTREEKRMIFARMGVETLVEYPLDMVTASILPEEFIWRILVEQMHAKYIAAGEDLSFGSGGTGDFRLLDALAPCFEYRTEVIDKVRRNGTVISSTAVRELVAKGCMEEAADLLGGPYSVLGEIVHGQKIGRTIGFPTLNIVPTRNKLLPPYGVYFSEVRFVGDGEESGDGNEGRIHAQPKIYRAVTNIGVRPTVTQHTATEETARNEAQETARYDSQEAAQQSAQGSCTVVTVETYLYDFEEDAYGRTAVCSLLKYVRPERRFDSLDALKAQLALDIAAGREYNPQREK